MQQRITDAIRAALPDAEVHLSSPDGVHYEAVVVSAAFADQPLVRQHQTVMNALKGEFDTERLHALRLKTMTPQRWAQQAQN